jgi:hypothetical protein
MRTQLRLALATVAALTLLAPAAPAQEKTGTVFGKVTYKGQPLTGGTVSFVTAKDKILTGLIHADGTYVVKAIPVGEVRLAVSTEPVKPAPKPPIRTTPPKDAQKPPKGNDAPKYVKIPPKYADPKTSDLKLVVKPGKQVHDIQLTD